jgi:hypothetical protein
VQRLPNVFAPAFIRVGTHVRVDVAKVEGLPVATRGPLIRSSPGLAFLRAKQMTYGEIYATDEAPA